jgi:hypothetical protein
MKKIIFLIVLSFTLSSCDKDNDRPKTLPPATQIGAGTFGCLVNGVPYVDNSGFFNCFYQLVDGEYFFGIRGRDNVGNLRQINIGSIKKNILTGENIPLNNYVDNEFYAEITYNGQNIGAFTTLESDGFINFNKFNITENIVSATFNFTIIDEFGNIYTITEGRFDAQFTQ